ncbi:unnamed protein product [Adineta ricciae]|uniref:G-protein coupled receptors family 1 profile domain-containing protein n=1 Tax=Adineta ricciae TaxID=249248 RepID=A0A815W124_ADIRI|nr:unnamed protein product [Adineta ricciae]
MFKEIFHSTRQNSFSLNLPKLCPTALWSQTAMTFADQSVVGEHPGNIFINTNNTIFVVHRQRNQILVWNENDTLPSYDISVEFRLTNSIFVRENGDIYIGDSDENRRVQRWIASNKTFVTVMKVASACYGLFIDVIDNLYCSMQNEHQVVKKSLHDLGLVPTIVAGTDILGKAPNQLNQPHGIFVDVNLDLYVADCENNRVQLFRLGGSNGITVVGGSLSSQTTLLSCPHAVVLDGQKYLFVANTMDHAIVGEGLHGFRCIVGCYTHSAKPNQLSFRMSLSFDRSGNIFVSDNNNHRIQKFRIIKSPCDMAFSRPKFCSTAIWHRNGFTFANETILGSKPRAIAIDTNDSVYFIHSERNELLIWHNGDHNSIQRFPDNFSTPASITVTIDDNIYIDNGQPNGRVMKWTLHTLTLTTATYVFSTCFCLFVDIGNNLYCSLHTLHRIVKTQLSNSAKSLLTVAGADNAGSSCYALDHPKGIFVDYKLNLYVADCGNNRVQVFPHGIYNGITIVGGSLSNETIGLNCPSGIALDVQNYLFIVDSDNHRIIGQSRYGFRCLLGCYGQGSHSTQLSFPSTLSFDRVGNIFVLDQGNNRIQKFHYLKNTCDTSSITDTTYPGALKNTSQIYLRKCNSEEFYYEAFEISVSEIYYYTIQSSSDADIDLYGYIYENNFNPLAPAENLLAENNDISTTHRQFKLDIPLYVNTTYILIVTTSSSQVIGEFVLNFRGGKNISIKRQIMPVNFQQKYSSEFTFKSVMYYRDCRIPKCYYESLEINVITTGLYIIRSESDIHMYGYIYESDFNPLKTSENLRLQHNGTCNNYQFKFITNLKNNTKYILVITTFDPYTMGKFSIFISGSNNISHHRFNPKSSDCVVGDQCNFYVKSIGLTLDDILHDELRSNKPLSDQSTSIKFSVTLTIIMFIVGLISSILSFLTFKNKTTQQVGCGLYLLASSITSLLTISMFTIKFWFLLITRINVPMISLTVFQGGCKFIEPILKLLLYLDNWFNACVAIERGFHIFKGINANKMKSKHIARWMILILPFCILSTLIHEPIFLKPFEYPSELNRNESNYISLNGRMSDRPIQCIAEYPRSVQYYNTFILFFHLVVPFIANLCSALFIIFGAARQRSKIKKSHKYIDHVRTQLKEHKQLIVSPIALLVLSSPRLIIALLPGCVKISEKLWLYLLAYFISFIPSILIFMIFVFPSELYMKAFKQSLNISWWRIH